ncbi:hypothetical protein J5N97_024796 [Dioscorea zingiberensis]|uniref:Uncharacterized protein n=1 Tax=Dioscorea zingiberensis TaxID=325984 RepID=A0A9D5H927_9LILI|nr:hypothetical protein J5N97_024796 [Dioscorea zingiberensis]
MLACFFSYTSFISWNVYLVLSDCFLSYILQSTQTILCRVIDCSHQTPIASPFLLQVTRSIAPWLIVMLRAQAAGRMLFPLPLVDRSWPSTEWPLRRRNRH